MTRTPLLLLGASLLLLLPALARADRVDDYLKGEMARNHIPGLCVAIVRDGRVDKIRAYGRANLEWDAPTTTDTAFQLASVTKPLTGTALMLLVQEGKLALGDPVGRYLPDCPPAWAAVTIRDLANHTSGIPDDLGPAPVRTADETLAAAAKLPLEHAPGAKSAYGITGYVVLQRVMERVGGRPFDALLRERVFAPLGMDAARFDNVDDSGPGRRTDVVRRRAGVYEWGGERQANYAVPFTPRSYSAGGLFASASDLAKWIAALDAGRLLRPEDRERLWTPARLADGTDAPFGVGWMVGTYRGRRTAGHSGGPALADILRFVDDKLTIIVLANQQRMYPYLAQGVADLLVPAPKIVDAPIPNRDPQTTAMLTGLLRGLADGKVDPAPFAPEARGPMVGTIEQFALPLFRSLGRPRALVLLADTGVPGGARVRRYRAWYGAKPVLWRFDLDAGGKIRSLEPTPE